MITNRSNTNNNNNQVIAEIAEANSKSLRARLTNKRKNAAATIDTSDDQNDLSSLRDVSPPGG